MNSSVNQALDYQTEDISPSIPKEIIIYAASAESSSSHIDDRKNVNDLSITDSFSITPVEWLSSRDNHKVQGCTVSLSSSSDCSSHDCSLNNPLIVVEDPLDFRMDWSQELENEMKNCITDHPELFLVSNDDDYDDCKDISDRNSLCSELSEDYEMESDMTAGMLWYGEQPLHDFSKTTCWVKTEEKER